MLENKEGKASMFALLAECEGCEEKFQLSFDSHDVNVQHKKEYKVNGRSIFLTYYDCPSCGRRHFVQVDDRRTMEMLKADKRLFIKLASKRAQDKPIQKSQLDKYKKRSNRLREYRSNLMKELTGSIIQDSETGASFELRFSV